MSIRFSEEFKANFYATIKPRPWDDSHEELIFDLWEKIDPRERVMINDLCFDMNLLEHPVDSAHNVKDLYTMEQVLSSRHQGEPLHTLTLLRDCQMESHVFRQELILECWEELIPGSSSLLKSLITKK